MHINPSEEQQYVIDILKDEKNAVVSAVAGAGKSTTVLFLAKTFTTKKILQLTYNSSLRQEVKEKVEKNHITNLEVHTYHSYAVKYYAHDSYTDIGIRKILREKTPPMETFMSTPPDIVVLDEVQDQTLLYYKFVYKVLKDLAHPFLLMVLGDEKQSLYEFKGADARYLVFAPEIWSEHPYIKSREFVKTTLRTSYRITNAMSHFVNDILLGENKMSACREGSPVVYIHNNCHNMINKIIFEIKNLMENHGAKPDDFFILAGSVKGKMGNIKRIENALVERGIPCNVPMFENDSMDEKVIQGKVVFSTFHCVKGRQRPYVFVVGFSQSYMDFMVRDEPHDVCPNTLYVACTRASERLYLLEEDKGDMDRALKFLKKTHAEMRSQNFVEFHGIPKRYSLENVADSGAASTTEPDSAAAGERIFYSTPTELIRFISEDVYDIISPIIEDIFVKETAKNEKTSPLEIPVVMQMSRGNYEEISDINGIAIPFIYYDYFARKLGGGTETQKFAPAAATSTIYKIVENELKVIRENKKKGKIYDFLEKKLKEIPKKCSSISDYLYLSNIYISLREHLYFKLFQIAREDYKWLSPNIIKKTYKIINESLKNDNIESMEDLSIEETIIRHEDEDYQRMDFILKREGIHLFRLNARVDLITPTTVWEIKCTSDITLEHLLQLVIYAWIWRVAKKNEYREFKILNIKTGEIQRLNATDEQLSNIVFELFKNKYNKYTKRTDEEFLQECAIVKN